MAQWERLVRPLAREFSSVQASLDEATASVFLQINFAAVALLDVLFSPERADRLLKMDIRQVEPQQIRRVLYLLFESYVAVFIKLFPPLEWPLRDALRRVGREPRVEPSPILEQTLAASEVDLAATGLRTWEQILAVTHPGSKAASLGVGEGMKFAAVFAACAVSAREALQRAEGVDSSEA